MQIFHKRLIILFGLFIFSYHIFFIFFHHITVIDITDSSRVDKSADYNLNDLNLTLNSLKVDLTRLKQHLIAHNSTAFIVKESPDIVSSEKPTHIFVNEKNNYVNASLQSKTSLIPTNKIDEKINSNIKKDIRVETKKKRVLIFTMDSITSYESESKMGGPAGEIIIRNCLQDALRFFGYQIDIKRSDGEFEKSNAKIYDIIILDSWTWAARGWVPKPVIRGHESKIYILDFFGSKSLKGSGLHIPPSRFLTPFGSPWNTFLGYYIKEDQMNKSVQLQQGIIWGKNAKVYENKQDLLNVVADLVPLVATTTSIFSHPNIDWAGHQTHNSWRKLLFNSKFLLGLGHPLLGPSAIDAIAAGCMFINPIYDTPLRGFEQYGSQHSFAAKFLSSHVCSYMLNDTSYKQLRRCIERALSSDLPAVVPLQFTWDQYLQRVATIFNIIQDQ